MRGSWRAQRRAQRLADAERATEAAGEANSPAKAPEAEGTSADTPSWDDLDPPGRQDGVRYVVWDTGGRVRVKPVPAHWETWHEYLMAVALDAANYLWRGNWLWRDFGNGRLRWTETYDAPSGRYLFTLEADLAIPRSPKPPRPGRPPVPPNPAPRWQRITSGWARPLIDAAPPTE